MSTTDTPKATRALPERPSRENLRKQAKRLAREETLQLAEAQRRLARQYGEPNWAALMQRVAALEPAKPLSPLSAAARAGDVALVRRLLGEGQPVEGLDADSGAPLWQACATDAPAEARVAIAEVLLLAGANPRRDGAKETALHAAARLGPLALVELLLRHNALEWQPDAKHRSPLQAARSGKAAEREAIIELLHRPVIRDAAFRHAVSLLHGGDAAGLARLLDAEPRLLREHILEPDCYRIATRQQYFRDPKLFWFIAGNPTLVKKLPPNMAAMAADMIARGVAQEDLDYTLELLMTSSEARDQGLQDELMALLLRAGARAAPRAIEMTLGHREHAPVLALLRAGLELNAPIAASLGYLDKLPALLRTASPEAVQQAFGLAVINRQNEAVRLALAVGADVNGFLPVHRHSTALHQAAIDENIELIALLLEHGARRDTKDTLWDAMPLDWANHGKHERAVAYFKSLEA
ncbi:ankyrin repeat domain-containing protein [Ferrovibrio sp.]|uniref:ankyrin repeat domain-containing protein n=1 Tax=Ferrovibrio sp. TaxID=1917215 RepID=UPI003D1508BA